MWDAIKWPSCPSVGTHSKCINHLWSENTSHNICLPVWYCSYEKVMLNTNIRHSGSASPIFTTYVEDSWKPWMILMWKECWRPLRLPKGNFSTNKECPVFFFVMTSGNNYLDTKKCCSNDQKWTLFYRDQLHLLSNDGIFERSEFLIVWSRIDLIQHLCLSRGNILIFNLKTFEKKLPRLSSSSFTILYAPFNNIHHIWLFKHIECRRSKYKKKCFF